MKLPIMQLVAPQPDDVLQALSVGIKERLSRPFQVKAALKLNQPRSQQRSVSNGGNQSFYLRVVEQVLPDGRTAKKLVDQLREHQTSSDKDPKYFIHLFADNAGRPGIGMNEQMFEDLDLQAEIDDCCSYGRNLTMFSIEGQSFKRSRTSKIFNGSTKARSIFPSNPLDSSSKPGLIRMTVESIFAHIFAAKANQEFAIKMSFLEINHEQVFDLLNDGDPVT